jgi:hypothetical protein
VWYPLQLERLTLATRLSPDECRARLAHTTSPWLAFQYGSVLPVRGFVRGRRFYLGPRMTTRALLRTWISGHVRKAEQMTVIDVSIGPNRVAGVFLTALLAMLAAGAVVATVLAFISPFQSPVGAVFSWVVVAAFVAVFFVFPAEDHPSQRAFLLEHVKKTLEAKE